MFGGLFGKGKGGAENPPTKSLSAGVTSSILGSVGTRSIPSMPAAAQKAFKLSIDPNAEAQDFIEVIESDEGLSARILKIANSVYFDRGKKSTTIEESVLVIGINELRCLLNANTLSEIFPSRSQLRAQYWAHDIATAIIAKHLAQRVNPSQVEVAFMGGLMHDVGKLLLIQRIPDEYQKVIALMEQKGLESTAAEEQIFPFDHTEVGQLIGERWNFSSDLLSMIRMHHAPWKELGSGRGISLAGIIKAADLVAHALSLGDGKGSSKTRQRAEDSLPVMWETLGIPQSESKDLLAGSKRAFELESDLYKG